MVGLVSPTSSSDTSTSSGGSAVVACGPCCELAGCPMLGRRVVEAAASVCIEGVLG